MATPNLAGALQHLQTLADAQASGDLTDAELLDCFGRYREEAAFTILLHRHGPMVLALCRRLLGDPHDAEDAFQATFLVLVRQARSVRKRGSLASWLYGVSRRVAARLRAQATRRRDRERRATIIPPANPPEDVAGQEVRTALDEELARLPEKYRAPVVLCYLEGKTQEQAAGELGCPRTSLTSRLARARTLLRRRLVRRGIGLPAGALGVALAEQSAPAALPALLTIATARAAVHTAGKVPAAGEVSPHVLALADAVGKTLLLRKIQLGAVLIAALAALAAGTGLAAHQARVAQQPPTPAAAPDERTPARPEAAAEAHPGIDRHGDPLPAGAVARLGTVRMRQEGFRRAPLAFAADGATLVSASTFGVVRFWEPKTGKELRKVQTARGETVDIRLSPDQRLVASVLFGSPRTIHLWDVSAGRPLRQLRVPEGQTAVRLAFSPDSRTLASSGGDNGVLLWDVGTGRLVRRLPLQGLRRGISLLEFAPGGRTLLTKGPDAVIHLWDLAGGKELAQFPSNYNIAPAHAFSPDGKTLAVGREWWVDLRDAATGEKPQQLRGNAEGSGPIIALAFSPDGRTLAVAASGYEPLRFWDVITGKERSRTAVPARGAWSLSFSPDGKTLASAGEDVTVHLWDVATGRELHEPAGHRDRIHTVAFSPDGRVLATHSQNRIDDHTLRLWEAAAGRPLRVLCHDATVQSLLVPMEYLQFPPGDNTLVSGHDDGTVRVWDFASGHELQRYRFGPNTRGENAWETSIVDALALSADGRTLTAMGVNRSSKVVGNQVVSTSSTVIRAWDLVTGKEVFAFQEPRDNCPWVLSPDGKTRASQNNGAHVRVRDARAGRMLLTLDGRCDNVLPVAFSPDGKLLAGVCHHGLEKPVTLELWELNTGKEIRRLRSGLKGLRLTVNFSADRRILAAAGDDAGGVELWNLATGEQLTTLHGNEAGVSCLAFSPDGRQLATGLGNSTALVWHTAGAVRRAAGAGEDLSPKQVETLWTDLAREDAVKGQAAVGALAAAPTRVLPFLKNHVRPAAGTDPGRIRQLIVDLDDRQFAVRESAMRELERLGTEAEPALRQMLQAGPSLEVRRRAEAILAGPRFIRSAEVLRRVRVVLVLERIGSEDARRLLVTLSQGAPNARETQEANAAVQRLSRARPFKP